MQSLRFFWNVLHFPSYFASVVTMIARALYASSMTSMSSSWGCNPHSTVVLAAPCGKRLLRCLTLLSRMKRMFADHLKSYYSGLTFANSSHSIFLVEKQREKGALLIAASIVAAIRLQGIDIKPSPKLTEVVKVSVELAWRVLAELERS
jgi:hypothetical protein